MKALAAALVVMALPVQASAATLTIKVQGVTGEGGMLKVGLCDAQSFLRKPDHGSISTAKSGQMAVSFKDLVPGDYAVQVFQDINENDRVDRNFLGIPTEPYGFSNNPTTLFGPPSFDRVKFAVKDGDNLIVVRLR